MLTRFFNQEYRPEEQSCDRQGIRHTHTFYLKFSTTRNCYESMVARTEETEVKGSCATSDKLMLSSLTLQTSIQHSHWEVGRPGGSLLGAHDDLRPVCGSRRWSLDHDRPGLLRQRQRWLPGHGLPGHGVAVLPDQDPAERPLLPKVLHELCPLRLRPPTRLQPRPHGADQHAHSLARQLQRLRLR